MPFNHESVLSRGLRPIGGCERQCRDIEVVVSAAVSDSVFYLRTYGNSGYYVVGCVILTTFSQIQFFR